MTLLSRYRAHRDDPYHGHAGSRARWDTRLAVGLPLAVALVIVVNFALAAVNPGVAKPRAAGQRSETGYQTLLIPSGRHAPAAKPDRVTRAGHRDSNAGKQVVIPSNSASVAGPAAASTGSAAAGAALPAQPARQAKPHRHQATYRTDANGYRIAPERDVAMVPTWTWLAHLEHSTKGFPSANSFSSDRTVPGAWYGYPSILPVIDSTSNRLRVRLAQRPDESVSWISRNAAVLTHTQYAILVDISQHWLYVFKDGIQQESYPVGTGAPGTPTPTGEYFLAFHAPPNGPGYGSVMLETSAHSRVIEHFEGGNDAIIAIHGPIDSQSDREIGDHGAAISNGCIRMHDWDLNQVRHVPNGTPIILTD